MDELVEFYERYMEAFNRGDRAAFAGFFHLPLTVVHAGRYDERRAGRALSVVTDPTLLWAPLPDHWASSTVDSVVPLHELAGFEPRPELVERPGRRPALLVTVTRWRDDGRPYEQVQVLYLLTREGGRLGIKTLVELAAAVEPA